MLKGRRWKEVRALLFYSFTSCPAEKCTFQLSLSRAIQGSMARGAVLKKFVDPFFSRGAL